MAPHQHHLEHGVFERVLQSPVGPLRCVARQLAARIAIEWPIVEEHAARHSAAACRSTGGAVSSCPIPFGPRMPTSPPLRNRHRHVRENVTLVPAIPRRAYPNETLSACSKAHTRKRGAARRRIAEHFFVRLVEEIDDPRVNVDAADDANRAADVDDRAPRILEQAAVRPKCGFGVEGLAAGDEAAEDSCARSPVQMKSSRTLMCGAPQQTVADAIRRGRLRGVVDGADFAVEERVGARRFVCAPACQPAASSTPRARAFEMLSVR